jgi:Domain of unknown function (DUF4258)
MVIATRFTAHASLMLQRRSIALEWVEHTLMNPASKRTDNRDPSLTLAFRQISEAGDKWLRVVYRMENKQTHLVVTAFFDRNQENKK